SSTIRMVLLIDCSSNSEEGDGSAGGRAVAAAVVQGLLLQRGVGAGQALQPLLHAQSVQVALGQAGGAGAQALHVGDHMAEDLVDAVLELQVDDQLGQVVLDQAALVAQLLQGLLQGAAGVG